MIIDIYLKQQILISVGQTLQYRPQMPFSWELGFGHPLPPSRPSLWCTNALQQDTHKSNLVSPSPKNVQKMRCLYCLGCHKKLLFSQSKHFFYRLRPPKSKRGAKSYKGDLLACLCHFGCTIHEEMTH